MQACVALSALSSSSPVLFVPVPCDPQRHVMRGKASICLHYYTSVTVIDPHTDAASWLQGSSFAVAVERNVSKD